MNALDPDERQQLLSTLARLLERQQYCQDSTASGEAGGTSSSNSTSTSSEAGGVAFAHNMSLAVDLLDRLVEADAQHHDGNRSISRGGGGGSSGGDSSSTSTSRSSLSWDLAADKQLLAAAADACSDPSWTKDFNSIASAVWGWAPSPHLNAGATQRRLACLSQALVLLQHARGEVGWQHLKPEEAGGPRRVEPLLKP